MADVVTREYKSDKAFNRDAEKMLAAGYRIAHEQFIQPRSGCRRYVLTGGLALIWKPKPKLRVTYTRE